jgi:hypothetical protein
MLAAWIQNLDPHGISLGLLAQARSAHAGCQFQLSVVLAHAACDVETGLALTQLVNRRCAELLDVLVKKKRSVCFDDDGAHRIYRALTSDLIRKNEWWQRFCDSRELRHRVAHVGAMPSPEEATDCIEIAQIYVDHVEGNVREVLNSA